MINMQPDFEVLGLLGSHSAYTKLGRLKVPVGTPIYECNDRCLCGAQCPNRIVQRGSKVISSYSFSLSPYSFL